MTWTERAHIRRNTYDVTYLHTRCVVGPGPVGAIAGAWSRGGYATRALRLAGAAAELRRLLGAPLRSAPKAGFDELLEPARRAVSGGDREKTWQEGKAVTVERAVGDALLADHTDLDV
jgi:hypothetical protein